MKISTALEHGMKIAGVDARESAKMLKKAGFDGVDLAICHDQEDPKRILRKEWAEVVYRKADALKAEGLEIAQCHLPYYPGHIDLPIDNTFRGYEEVWMEAMLHALELAHEVGAKVAVVHPLTIMGEPEATILGNIEHFKKYVPALEKYGMKLAIENVFSRRRSRYVDGYCGRTEELLAMINGVGSEQVGACIDTGHARIFRLNQGNMVRAIDKKLFALHVNGNAGGDEHNIPFTFAGGAERTDYPAFCRALKAIEFKGYMNLELGSGRLPAIAAQPYLDLAAKIAGALADMAE